MKLQIPQASQTKVLLSQPRTDASTSAINSPKQDNLVRNVITSGIMETDQDFDVLVFGSIAVDHSCNYMIGHNLTSDLPAEQATALAPSLYTSNPAEIETSVGGVGYNVALAIQRVGAGLPTISLSSLVARDL